MNILGWFLAVCGIVGLIFGVRMMLKGKKMGTVPFRKPSEIAAQGVAVADAKQRVSTEGQVQQGPQPLFAPMSGEPCLAYEILVERKWEKHVQTEQGSTKKTGSDRVHREYRGAVFQLTDGGGTVTVDAREEPDTDLEQTHSSSVSVGMTIPGALHFGKLQLNTPHVSGDARTTAFHGTEKILRPSATLYALGQLAQGPDGLAIATPKGIGTGKLILHHKGRAALLGATKRNMILGYALGGVLLVGGTGLGLFGPAAESTGCDDKLTGAVACDGRMYAAEGIDYAWMVAQPGIYSITVRQPKVANPVDGALTVYDGSGAKLAYNDGGSAGADAHVQIPLAAGTYKLNVADFAHGSVSGGYGFKLLIERKGDAPSGATATPPAVASATATAAPATVVARTVHATTGTTTAAAPKTAATHAPGPTAAHAPAKKK